MAMRDWNNNGKDDAFDMFMDYQLYKHTFGKDDDGDNTSLVDNVNYDNEDEAEDDFETSSSFMYGNNIHDRSVQEDYYGIAEMSGKGTEDILRLLVNRKKTMDYYFETCSIESGFRDVMDNRQMGKDFWLFELAKQLDFSILQRQQKIQLLQLLLDTFSVDNPMTAEEHYKNMGNSDPYYQYMTHCFGKVANDGAIFWRIFGTMGGNDGERMPMTIGYMKEYMKFMVQLEEYLKRMFPESGFGGHAQQYVSDLMDYVVKVIDAESDAVSNTNYLVNPIFPCISL